MKVFLRLLITALIIAGIGVGVWAIFFRSSDDEKVFDALVDYDEFVSTTNVIGAIDEINVKNPTPVISGVLNDKNQDFYKVKSIIFGDVEGGKESQGLIGKSGVYSSQEYIIKYFYKYAQFTGKVGGSDAKAITNALKALKSSHADVMDAVNRLTYWQDQIVAANSWSGTQGTDNKTTLLNLYKEVLTKVVSMLDKQQALCDNVKAYVIKYAFDDNLEHDTKTILIDSLSKANNALIKQYQSDTANNLSFTSDVTNLLSDTNKVFIKVNTISIDEIVSDNSAAFTTAYIELLSSTAGETSLSGMFAATNKATLKGISEATDLATYGIRLEDKVNIDTILDYLFLGGN